MSVLDIYKPKLIKKEIFKIFFNEVEDNNCHLQSEKFKKYCLLLK